MMLLVVLFVGTGLHICRISCVSWRLHLYPGWLLCLAISRIFMGGLYYCQFAET